MFSTQATVSHVTVLVPYAPQQLYAWHDQQIASLEMELRTIIVRHANLTYTC